MPFPASRHHIVFVSSQLLPSMLGIVMAGADLTSVHAVVTAPMKQASAVLRQVAEGRSKRYGEYLLHGTDQQHIFDLLDRILAQCEDQIPALNLTGGMKLMTLAAAEWAYANDVPAFYIDTSAGQIVLPGRRWEYLDLPDMLSVADLLASYGYTVRRWMQAPVPQERRATLTGMLELVCDAFPAAQDALLNLNVHAQQARITPDRIVEDKAVASPQWEALLELCRKSGMLQLGNGRIAFPDEAALKWCGGLWLEEFVRMTLYKLHCNKKITSWASSVEVIKDGVDNELDALFSVRNCLFVIECKTAAMRLGKKSAEPDRVKNMLYKADSLHDRLGGVFARSILCSINPLTNAEQRRAKNLGILVITGRKLLGLDDALLRWSAKAW
jgi:hypothetical protein